MSDLLVGLDIGTSTVRVVIGEVSEDGQLQIIGVGKAPSTGLRNGVIVNIQATMSAITNAIESAEFMSGREVKAVITGIGGSQVESINSRGVVAVSDRGNNIHEITKEDVERVIEAASAVNWPLDRKILHVVPQVYTVDDVGRIKDPVNMIGVRLEADVHIVTAGSTSIQNIFRCVNRAGYEIDNVVLKTLAAAYAVTTEEERELGSILIDLGGGSTDAIVLADGAPICSVSIPVSGFHITNDLSVILSISYDIAERIKKTSGCSWEPYMDPTDTVTIPGVGGRAPQVMPRTEVCRIMQPRVEEILTLVRDKIAVQVGNRPLTGNVVLTGGGAVIPGILEVAYRVFDTSAVRIGSPCDFGGLKDEYCIPEYATAVGLIVSSLYKIKTRESRQSDSRSGKGGKFLSSVRDWFREFF